MKRSRLQRKTRIKPKRSTPRNSAGRNGHGDMGNAWATVWVRQGGLCALCSNPMTDAHHRQTRRFGPDCPGNLIGLCCPCHHDAVHNQPAFALARGLIISRHATDPCAKPVYLDSQWWTLSCDGSRRKLLDATSGDQLD